MKKVFVILLTVALVLSMAGSGYGKTIEGSDTSNPTKTAKSTVTLTLTDSYVVTIPDAFYLDAVDADNNGTVDYYAKSQTVRGKIKHINEHHDLVVSIDTEEYLTEHGWWLKKVEAGSTSNDHNEWFEYYMKAGGHVEDTTGSDLVTDTNPNVLKIPYNTYNEQTSELHVKLVGRLPTVAGTYEDILTFKVLIVPQPSGTP